MTHIVDLNKPSIKQAIAELGISPDHLLTKELSDFQDPDCESSIAKLRFDYFTRKQQEYLRLITEKIKSFTAKYRKSVQKKPSLFLTQVSTPSTIPESRSNNLNRAKFLNSIKEIYKNDEISKEIDKKIEVSREARLKLLSVKNMRKVMMEKLKEKQIENLEKLRKSEVLGFKNYKFDSFTPKTRQNRSSGFLSKEENFLDTEPEVREKLRNIEEKMKKSEEIHSFYIKQKKTAIHKILEKESLRSKSKISHSDSERLLKFIEKQKALNDRHRSLLSTKEKVTRKFREKLKTRIEQAQKKSKSLQDSNTLEKKTKVKMARSELNIKKLQTDWQKKLDLKTEISRVKEENIQAEQERFINIQKFRRNQILEKQFSDSERVSKMIQSKHEKVENTFNSLHHSMLEKEKYQTLISEALRSPHSRKFKQKLTDLSI